MIELVRLRKQYGSIVAVDGVDLVVKKGEIFGFLGPNGAGKTTTIRMLTTLTKPTSGYALVNGYDVVKEAVKAKMGIGVVPQYINLDGDLSAEENLELCGLLYRMGREDRRKRASELLTFAGLAERARYPVKTFSGGMKRRLMIVCALMHRPQILFLDEPTVGLDPQSRRSIWDLIRRINSDGGTIFLTTHYIEEAEHLCHRVGIIDNGRLIVLDTPQKMLTEAGNWVVEIYRNGETERAFFETREEAAHFAAGFQQDALIRSANLEDVFIRLTGKRGVD
ncbi:MAG: ATP-binding cassette domain-containing protein [Firmicutes bacterium]|nr:ATP-binding cassette domain-containing protein [Bacillota bacterium]